MPRLLIGNDFPDPNYGHIDRTQLGPMMARWAMRVMWHIKDNDILILPLMPDEGHLKYIAHLLGVNYDSLQIIVPPQVDATDLTVERIINKQLFDQIREKLGDQSIDAIVPLSLDASVSALAREFSVELCYEGCHFASQEGCLLANSKAVFRAIAAGVDAPIPEGQVINHPDTLANSIIRQLLYQSRDIILKKEFGQGCRGNEVLTTRSEIRPNGGRRGVLLLTKDAVQEYVRQNWKWLSDDGRHRVVVERYFANSRAIFAEFHISDAVVAFSGIGEMLALPIADGQVIPAQQLPSSICASIVDNGRRLATAMQAIGYRGILSADAIVTPCNQVLFSEYNGRITGSTHIYSAIGAQLVGKEHMSNRVMLERRGWSVPSFKAAVQMLVDSQLDFNHNTLKGVVLSGTFIPERNVISYTVVAESLDEAENTERKLHQVSPRVVEVLN